MQFIVHNTTNNLYELRNKKIGTQQRFVQADPTDVVLYTRR